MSEQRSPPSSFDDLAAYYGWALAQESGRTELVDGLVVTMAAEQLGHVRAKTRAWLALTRAIEESGAPCEALADGVTVEVGDRTAYEPDAVVNGGERIDDTQAAAPRPIIIVEVTSPSNSRVDLFTKAADYLRLPTLQHYLVVHLAKRVVIHHGRQADGKFSISILASGPIVMDPPGIAITVEQLLG